MKKIILVALMLSMILMAASPAMAALAGNAPTPPAYQVEGNTVTIGGDVQTDCRSFAIALREGYNQGLSQSQQQEVLAQCQPQGVTAPETNTTPLPDTGGPSLLLPVIGLALAGLGAMGLSILRRRQ